jgi:hypothetical protein
MNSKGGADPLFAPTNFRLLPGVFQDALRAEHDGLQLLAVEPAAAIRSSIASSAIGGSPCGPLPTAPGQMALLISLALPPPTTDILPQWRAEVRPDTALVGQGRME